MTVIENGWVCIRYDWNDTYNWHLMRDGLIVARMKHQSDCVALARQKYSEPYFYIQNLNAITLKQLTK